MRGACASPIVGGALRTFRLSGASLDSDGFNEKLPEGDSIERGSCSSPEPAVHREFRWWHLICHNYDILQMEKPLIEIRYCTQCHWLLRAAWMAQELLTTFEQEIGSVALTPGTGGVFDIAVDGEIVWSRKEIGAFPISRN